MNSRGRSGRSKGGVSSLSEKNAKFRFAFRLSNKSSGEIPIYNYVSNDNPITYDRLKELSAKYGLDIPSNRAIWYYSFRNNKYRIVHLFFMYFMHLLPALLVDTVAFCMGKQPK